MKKFPWKIVLIVFAVLYLFVSISLLVDDLQTHREFSSAFDRAAELKDFSCMEIIMPPNADSIKKNYEPNNLGRF